MFKKDAPCRYCEKRELGCHANCQEYLDWSKVAREVYRSDSKYTVSDGYLIENGISRASKMQRNTAKRSIRFNNAMGR